MRLSLFHLSPKAAIPVAVALFAMTVLAPATVDAKAISGMESAAATKAKASLIEVAAISRQDARNARRSIRSDLREGCRAVSERPNRRVCFREAHREMRSLRDQAREAFRDCRASGGSRSDCRQTRRNFWLDHANGGGNGDDATGDAPRSDD